MKSVGFAIPKSHHVVAICLNEETGEKVAIHNAHRAFESDMTVIGVYLCDTYKYNQRMRLRYFPVDKNKMPQGLPEGFTFVMGSERDKRTNKWFNNGKWELMQTNYNSHRESYKRHLQGILKKAQEFIAVGIDKKAALIAARKCSCQVH